MRITFAAAGGARERGTEREGVSERERTSWSEREGATKAAALCGTCKLHTLVTPA